MKTEMKLELKHEVQTLFKDLNCICQFWLNGKLRMKITGGDEASTDYFFFRLYPNFNILLFPECSQAPLNY